MADGKNHHLADYAEQVRGLIECEYTCRMDALRAYRDIGAVLIVASEEVVQGTFGRWLAAEFRKTHNWANWLMRLCREWNEIERAIEAAAAAGVEHHWGVKAVIKLPQLAANGFKPMRPAAGGGKPGSKTGGKAAADAAARIAELEVLLNKSQRAEQRLKQRVAEAEAVVATVRWHLTAAEERAAAAEARLAGKAAAGNPVIRPADLRRLLSCAETWKRGAMDGERQAGRLGMQRIAWSIALHAVGMSGQDNEADEAAA